MFKIGLFKQVLEVLSVEPRPRYCKTDLCSFIQKMNNLSTLNMHDERRALVSTDTEGATLDHTPTFSPSNAVMFKKAKYLVYSGYKLCLVDKMLGQLEVTDFDCQFEYLQIVDQAVKSEYLINLRRLSSIYIDWQEELAGAPWSFYHKEWFTKMLDDPQWPTVAERLSSLEVVFPSTYMADAYALPVQDCVRLLDSAKNLTRLRLKGAGIYGEYLNLNTVIKHAVNLKSLELERCDANIDPLPWNFKNPNLQSFSFAGGKVTRMALFVSLIRTTMSELVSFDAELVLPVISSTILSDHKVELVIQPESRPTDGFCCSVSPMELMVLGEMRRLRDLSVALSSQDFTSNMTSLFAILTNGFKNLVNFNVGWYFSEGMSLSSNNDIVYKMSWLKQFLKAESVELNVGLDYNHHKAIFEASKVRNDNIDAFVWY